MHKCIVCGNKSTRTKVNRPGVMYHGFPKDKYMRRKWLNVFGIDNCYDWQRVCSDHFLKENYKPGNKRFLFSNTIPQPYKNFNGNGFPSNYASQSNDVRTGNNEILPMEQNIIKDENIEIAAVNNFESRRRSSRRYKNNADMSNKNMLNHTLGSGLRCSVKNCFNRLSESLSLFGYPKDFMLRKKWIEKSGIKIDPGKIIPNGIRVCSTHFEDNCFKNTELKNRLKPGSVPSLFFDDDIIDTTDTRKYISSARVPANRWFDRINTPSCSNVESDKKPLSAYMDSTARNVKRPNSLPLPINEVPVLSTCKDQFITPIDNKAAEQSSEEKKNNALDNTHNTSMMIDDSSSKSPLSITLETIDLTEPSVNLSISPKIKSNSSELIEIKTPATSKCISLPRMSVIHKSNSGYSTRTSQCIMMDVCNTKQFTKEKNRFIFELSKKVVLPSIFWRIEHIDPPNSTIFCQQDTIDVTVKTVHFYNSLVPIIQMYGKKYEYNTPITTMKELDDLLDKIDRIEKCYGRYGFVFEQCKRYFDNSVEDIFMCSGCQGLVKDRDLERVKKILISKNKTIENLMNKIAERKKIVFQLKKSMAESKRNRQHRLALKPSGISNIMKS